MEAAEAHAVKGALFVSVEIADGASRPPRNTHQDAASSGREGHLAFGLIDMRKGIEGLAVPFQDMLSQDPFSGHLFAKLKSTVRQLAIEADDALPTG